MRRPRPSVNNGRRSSSKSASICGRHPILQIEHRLLHGRQLHVEMVDVDGVVDVGEHALREGGQASGVDAQHEVGRRRCHTLEADRPGNVPLIGSHSMGENRGDILERQVHQEPRQEPVSLLCQRQLVVEVDLPVIGKEMAGLQLDERRRNQQELARHREIHAGHHIEVLEILGHEIGQAEFGDLNLM